jgi:hypothetical protein
MLQPTKTNKATTVADFVSCLLFSRTQAHIFHLQTSSYAKHIALNEYYDEIVDKVDELVESYQGCNPNITGYSNNYTITNREGAVESYFENLCMFVKDNRAVFGDESDLQNIIDEIIALIKSTLYKLKKLS